MRIVFAGSGAFGIPCLKALAASDHEIPLVISQPDRPAGRRKTLTPPPLAAEARALGLPLFQPERINRKEAREELARHEPDLMIVVAYGQILRPKVLELPRRGCLNVHGSVLPRWRGASPIAAGILAGDAESGVTIMQMDAGLDTGDILSIASTAIGERESAGSLHDRLAEMAAPLLLETLKGLEAGAIEARPQTDADATLCGLISKEDGRLDFREEASALERRVRAMTPWPGAFARLDTGTNKELRLSLEEVRVVPGQGTPGTLLVADRDELVVATGKDALRIERLRSAGRASLSAEEFLRGSRLADEAHFIIEEEKA